LYIIAFINFIWWQGLTTKSISGPHSVAHTQNGLVSDDTNLLPQSGIFCHETPDTNTQQRTVGFHDGTTSMTCEVESDMDQTRYGTADNATDLAHFFERPVRIGRFDWAVGGNLDSVFYPWDLWMKSARVANRLCNFRNFKGKLHVKFMINGNPFYWGRAFCSFTPYHDTAGTLVRYNNDIGSFMPAMQRPHIFLDPSSSDGGEMVLPFFWDEDCIDLTTVDIGQYLGDLWMKSLVPLEHAQGLTHDITITLLAWATDVELSTPTQLVVAGLSPQAGDEYGDGVVSRPANLVAALARKAESIPAIAPYAMATRMVSNMISGMASILGYSRPRVIKETTNVKVWQNGDMASTDQQDNAMTLALTSKQELTIDPRTIGLGSVDEMSFDYLHRKYSYLGMGPWTTTDAENKVIMSFPVTPSMFITNTLLLPPSDTGAVLSTTAFTAMCFDNWRGSMTYKFTVVGSGYHRGRLLILWDPVLCRAVPELNTTYSKIIDIADQKEFEVTIGWGSNLPALFTSKPLMSAIAPTQSTLRTDGTIFSADPFYHNGVVTVYVLNELVSSGSNTSPVQVLLHSCSYDMEYYTPASDGFIYSSYFPTGAAEELAVTEGKNAGRIVENARAKYEELKPQSGTVDPATQVATVDAPTDAGDLGGETDTPPSIMTILAGEVVRSFRPLLKRYARLRTLAQNVNIPVGEYVHTNWSGKSYPPFRGVEYSGVAGDHWPMTLIAMVTSCYALRRGAMRVMVIPEAESNPTPLTISRTRDGNFTQASNVTYPITDVNLGTSFLLNERSFSGVSKSQPVSGSVCHVEVPCYEALRALWTSSLSTDDSYCLGWRVSNVITNNTDDVVKVRNVYSEYIASGEDYTLFFFMGIPQMWYRP
jgi:hypothetical protein